MVHAEVVGSTPTQPSPFLIARELRYCFELLFGTCTHATVARMAFSLLAHVDYIRVFAAQTKANPVYAFNSVLKFFLSKCERMTERR